MRLELYNAAQARWFSGLVEYPVNQNEVMTIFNNTGYDITYNLVSPNGCAENLIYSGATQKISRLGMTDYCVISGNGRQIMLERPDITDKLLIIDSRSQPYVPNPGFVGSLEQKMIKYYSKKGAHMYLD